MHESLLIIPPNGYLHFVLNVHVSGVIVERWVWSSLMCFLCISRGPTSASSVFVYFERTFSVLLVCVQANVKFAFDWANLWDYPRLLHTLRTVCVPKFGGMLAPDFLQLRVTLWDVVASFGFRALLGASWNEVDSSACAELVLKRGCY